MSAGSMEDELATVRSQLDALAESLSQVAQHLSAPPRRYWSVSEAAQMHPGVSQHRIRRAIEQRLLRSESWTSRGGRMADYLPATEIPRIPAALRALARLEAEAPL